MNKRFFHSLGFSHCKVTYKKDKIIRPRKIRKPDDIRPGTKKGKLDTLPIWVVEIMMPKKLIADMYNSYAEKQGFNVEPAIPANTPPLEPEQAEEQSDVDTTLSSLESV